jgi:hypothetical protein
MNELIVFVYKGRYFVRDTETICYFSSISKSYGYNTDLVYDEDVFGVTDNVFSFPILNYVFSLDKVIAERVISLSPFMVVFLLNFNNIGWVKRIGSFLTKSNIKTIVISPLDGLDDKEIDFASYVLVGEPEKVFDRFVQKIKRREELLPKKMQVDGLCDVDKLPLPDKSLFSRYIDFSLSYMVYTSKGCIGKCSYCEETIYSNKFGPFYYRRRSPAKVIEELILAKKKYNPREIIFKDSVFTVDKKWLKEFLKMYTQEIKVPYKCFGKAEFFDEEIAYELKSSGCYCIEFGIQTLNEKIRKEVLYRQETFAHIEKALKICDKYQLYYDLDHMFGLPGETIEDHKKAVKFYHGLKYLNRIKCHNLVVYPQSEIKKFYPSGTTEDFFSGVAGQGKMKVANRCFEKIFKILPLLPEWLVNFFMQNGKWRIFNFIPGILIIIGQILIAIKNRDKRFKIYSRLYPIKVYRWIKSLCL